MNKTTISNEEINTILCSYQDKNAVQAEKDLKKRFPDFVVERIGSDRDISLDMRENRIRIWENEKGEVHYAIVG